MLLAVNVSYQAAKHPHEGQLRVKSAGFGEGPLSGSKFELECLTRVKFCRNHAVPTGAPYGKFPPPNRDVERSTASVPTIVAARPLPKEVALSMQRAVPQEASYEAN